MTDFNKTIEEAKKDMLPFESWERLAGETFLAFAAFCAFRDLGAERNIRKAVEETEKIWLSVKNDTGFGVTGLCNTAGKIGLPTMTDTLKN